MSRWAKFIYAAFLVALAVSAWSNEAPWPAAVHPSTQDWDRGADPDYMQGLAKLGIVRLPDYKPPPPVSH